MRLHRCLSGLGEKSGWLGAEEALGTSGACSSREDISGSRSCSGPAEGGVPACVASLLWSRGAVTRPPWFASPQDHSAHL